MNKNVFTSCESTLKLGEKEQKKEKHFKKDLEINNLRENKIVHILYYQSAWKNIYVL